MASLCGAPSVAKCAVGPGPRLSTTYTREGCENTSQVRGNGHVLQDATPLLQRYYHIFSHATTSCSESALLS